MNSPDVDISWGATRQQELVGVFDRSIEYIRWRGHVILPTYGCAVLPQTIAVYYGIDAVASQDRGMVPMVSAFLAVATLWRWVFTAAVQYQVQTDVRGERPGRFWSRLPAVIAIRSLAGFLIGWGMWMSAATWRFPLMAIVWGPIHAITSIYGMLIGGLGTPLLFESSEHPVKSLGRLFQWIQRAQRRLGGLSLILGLLVIWLAIAIVVLHITLANVIVSSFLGLDATDLKLTFMGVAWILAMCYLLFLVVDLFWSVASVFLFYDLQSRRLGSDLRLRLRTLRGANPS